MADLDEEDGEWVAGLGEEDVDGWRELLGGSAGGFPVAIRLLALRTASIGLSRGVTKVMQHRFETESPFFDLVDAAGRLAQVPALPDARDSAPRNSFPMPDLRRGFAFICGCRMARTVG
jgi:hypothetical protein